jgi:hypothetical protein
MQKYLSKNKIPKIFVIEYVSNSLSNFEEKLNSLEEFYISKFKELGHRLTNLTSGGEGMKNPSPELREKLRNIQKQVVRNPMSDETKKKISLAKKGVPNPKFAEKMKGRKHTKEHREAIAAGNLGNIRKPEKHFTFICPVCKKEETGYQRDNKKFCSRECADKGAVGKISKKRRMIRCLNDNKVYDWVGTAALAYGLTKSNVGGVAGGTRKSTFGYKFIYIESITENDIIINIDNVVVAPKLKRYGAFGE